MRTQVLDNERQYQRVVYSHALLKAPISTRQPSPDIISS